MERDLKPGDVFAGRYKLGKLLGEGPIGRSYAAYDVLAASELVVLKLLHMRMRQLPAELREIRRLSSPRLVRRLDVGVLDGHAFIVSEPIEGRPLDALLQDEPLPGEVTLQLMAAVADGLAALHRQGLLHGALAPRNIFITSEGELKLADYGLLLLPSPELAAAHAAFLAPELWTFGKGSAASDLFALGAIAYRMVTGIVPFAADSAEELRRLVCSAEPVPPQQIDDLIPGPLSELIMQLLMKDPEKRPASAERVMQLIEAQAPRAIGAGPDLLAGRDVLPAENALTEEVVWGGAPKRTRQEGVEADPPPLPPAMEPPPEAILSPAARAAAQPAPDTPKNFLFLYKLPFSLVMAALFGLLLFYGAGPVLRWLWEVQGGEGDGGSLVSGLLVFAFTAVCAALPIFALAWIFHPLRGALRVWLLGSGFFAALLLLLFGINIGRLLWCAHQYDDEVTAARLTQRLPRTLQFTVQSGVEIAMLAPRGTSYYPETDDAFPDFYRDSERSRTSQVLHLVLLMVYIVFLAGLLWRVLKEAGLETTAGRILILFLGVLCAAEYMLLVPAANLLRWDVLREQTVQLGPMRLIFEMHMVYYALLNWSVFLMLALASAVSARRRALRDARLDRLGPGSLRL